MAIRLFCLALPPAAETARGVIASGVDLTVPDCCVLPPRVQALCTAPMQVFCASDEAPALATLLESAVQAGSVATIRGCSALRGRDFGQWTGMALSTLPADAVQALTQDADFTPPEGESWRQFTARLMCWLDTAVPDGTQALLMAAPSVLVAFMQGIVAPAATAPPDLDMAAGAWLALTRNTRWRVRLL
ncbi:MAG: histidine phosphatase family protein [Acetobacter papayae]|uniref:histidine phosphatase family protein n=1 Tax=Acetobacter papayae TaxID=1076592 RepID=UPI0039ED1B22